MTTLLKSSPVVTEPVVLENGDRMSREEFHRAYERTPKHFKAELIGGVVHVPSPLRRLHGSRHLRIGTLLSVYEGNTPGVEAGDNATILLGDESEPQPDLYLRVLPDFGGQSMTNRDDYIVGAPELIIEVALSSRSIDLHAKREDYGLHGVREYLVASVADRRMYWFDLAKQQELTIGADGIIRAQTFPGLWIHIPSLFAWQFQPLMETLLQGIASPEHGDFVRRLEAAKKTP